MGEGEDPDQSAPNPERMEQALERAEFGRGQETFLTPTAQLADVMLPTASGYEKDGTYTNLERLVSVFTLDFHKYDFNWFDLIRRA